MSAFEQLLLSVFYTIHIISYTVTLLKDPGVATTKIVEFDDPIDVETAK